MPARSEAEEITPTWSSDSRTRIPSGIPSSFATGVGYSTEGRTIISYEPPPCFWSAVWTVMVTRYVPGPSGGESGKDAISPGAMWEPRISSFMNSIASCAGVGLAIRAVSAARGACTSFSEGNIRVTAGPFPRVSEGADNSERPFGFPSGLAASHVSTAILQFDGTARASGDRASPEGGVTDSGGVFAGAASMKRCHRGPPTIMDTEFCDIALLSLFPTHTPAAREGVYPMTHASR